MTPPSPINLPLILLIIFCELPTASSKENCLKNVILIHQFECFFGFKPNINCFYDFFCCPKAKIWGFFVNLDDVWRYVNLFKKFLEFRYLLLCSLVGVCVLSQLYCQFQLSVPVRYCIFFLVIPFFPIKTANLSLFINLIAFVENCCVYF